MSFPGLRVGKNTFWSLTKLQVNFTQVVEAAAVILLEKSTEFRRKFFEQDFHFLRCAFGLVNAVRRDLPPVKNSASADEDWMARDVVVSGV